MATLDTLSVLANPYAHVDHEGRPAGACPYEVRPGATPSKRYVGAKLRATITFKPNEKEDYRSPEQDSVFEYSEEPSTVPNTQYYRDRVRDGDIVAADESTAKKSGVAFVSPRAVLAAARTKAISDWVAMYGEPPAFAAEQQPQKGSE